MRKKKEQIISIHYYFATLFLLTTIECTSAFIEYDLFNNNGKRSIGFSGFNVILKSARNTLSRLVALLISLGYGLVMNKIGSYQTRIMFMCFSFFVAHIIHTGS